MAVVLTVIHPFGDYKRGDKIKDAEEMQKVLAGENARHVVKTSEKTDAAQ